MAELRPDHVSLYVLEVEGKTLLSHRAGRGTLALPDDDLVADLYALSVAELDVPFLGFGMSAHSYLEGRRSCNVASYGAYCRRIEEGGPLGARDGERVLSESDRCGEALFTGLRRRDGIDLVRFRARYRVDPLETYAAPLADPLAARLLEIDDGRLRLTERGVLLSNEVFRAFV